MPIPKYQEPNLLVRYTSDPNSSLYIVSDMLREGFLQGVRKRFDAGLLDRAREQFNTIRKAYDASTYPFIQDDLSPKLYNEGSRVIMIVNGGLYGRHEIKTSIPFDLGSNPSDLFKKDVGNNTIDDIITIDKAGDFIEQHRGYLSRNGFKRFEIENSLFFYLKQSDLGPLSKEDGHLDMVKLKELIPLLVPTEYVVLDKVNTPTFEEYMDLAPVHMSYRLKRSFASGMLDKLGSKKGGITLEGGYNGESHGVMVDIRALRVIEGSMDDVYRCHSFLQSSPTLGKSKIKFLYDKRYDEHPGGSAGGTDFKAIKVVAEVQTRGYEPVTSEFQIILKEWQWVNEFGTGKTSHRAHQRKREHDPRRVKFSDYYENILTEVFGSEKVSIPIEY